MLPPRSQPSGAQNRKRKKKEEELVKSQRGSLNRFIIRRENVSEIPVENPCENVNENIEKDDENIENQCEDANDNNVNDDENIENHHDANENIENDDENAQNHCGDTNENNKYDERIATLNIFDPRNWDGLNKKMKDLLVEKGPIRETTLNFPMDSVGRRFSYEYYIRKLQNGDTYDQKWLIYSKELDKVFCFCCKLFKDARSKSQLASEGINDWKHLGEKLSLHENSPDHMTNLKIWYELRLRLNKNQTLDKELQELIKKDTEH